MTIPEFARSIEVSQDTIYKIIRGTIPLSKNVIKSIIKTYPNINKGWLESGTGEMYSWKQPEKEPAVLKENKTEYGCRLCAEKERYIKSLEERVEEQKKVIETHEKCIESLRLLGGGHIKSGSG